jgi:hypothetical protein
VKFEDGLFEAFNSAGGFQERENISYTAGQHILKAGGGCLLKSRNIGADRQFDDQFPGVIRVVIILAEPFPNLGCRSTKLPDPD